MSGKKVPELRFPGFITEWSVKPISSICDFIVPGRNKPKSFQGSIPWITTPDITNRNIVYSSRNGLKISKEQAQKIGSKIVPKKSIIMSCVGELGIVAITGSEMVINQQLHAFIPKGQNNYIYILYALSNQKRYMQKVATKTALPYMNKDNCNSIPLPLPSLPEQQKIAAFLSDIDKKIELLTRKKELMEQYKKGMMQKLFSRELRFKDENGVDFPDWEEKRLGEVAKSISSGKSTGKKEGGKYPFWGSTGIIGYSKQYDYKGDCILIARVGANAGSLYSVKGTYCVSDNTLMLFVDSTTSLQFIHYFLKYYGLHRHIFGSGQPLVTGGILKSIKMCLPNLFGQQKIAGFLSDLDTKITAVGSELNQLNEFKRGLLQKLFI